MSKLFSKYTHSYGFFASAVLLVVPLITASGASAQSNDNGFYVNVGGAFLTADFEPDAVTVPTSAVAGGVNIPATRFDFDEVSANAVLINGRLGYRLNKFIAIEVDGGVGVSGDNISQDLIVPVDVAGFGTVDVDVTADVDANINNYVIGFARAILPVTDDFDVFVRGGYGRASFDIDGTATASLVGAGSFAAAIPEQSLSEDGFAAGIGAEYRFNGRHGLRADLSALTGDADALFFAASYSYRF